jgi:hypothetical protein
MMAPGRNGAALYVLPLKNPDAFILLAIGPADAPYLIYKDIVHRSFLSTTW